ncbi:MAG: HAMP domain-containing histidine kinase [Clostridia bacterium]|nr:HAMP domain-containing histidine kinase [Clostridia bacterium]
MIRKLQRKFVWVAMLSLLIVLTLLVGLINGLNYRNLVKEADETLEMLADFNGDMDDLFPDDFEDDFDDDDDDNDFRSGRKELPPDFRGERRFQARYFTVELSASGELGSVNTRKIGTVDEKSAVAMAYIVSAGNKTRGFYSGYRYAGIPTDDGTRWLFLNREMELSTFRSFLWTSIGISFGASLLVLLLLILLSSRIIRPISESYEKQKRFITDAGHELKTPITIIRADADVLEEDLGENEWLQDIRSQTERLGSLTNDLIYLSRMEEDGIKMQMTSFSLSDAVIETAQPFQSVAMTQNKTFSLSVEPLLTLYGDEKSIRKLVSILLDNAMKYSPENGEIHLTLSKTAKQIHFSVTNTAEPMEKGNQDCLFDRFYRQDSSRNSETGGFGLGLSIARAVVQVHKGKIHAFSSDGCSLTVETVFLE